MSGALVAMPSVVFDDGEPTVPAPTESERLAAQLVDDAQILTRPAPAEVVEGRLLAGSTLMLFGAAGVGKTFLATGLSLSVASGQSWLGARVLTGGGPVVYVAGEGLAGFSRRIHAGKAALRLPLETAVGLYILGQGIDLMSGLSVEVFLRALDRIGPALIVFDTLARNMLGDDSSAADVSRVVASLDRIGRETGAMRLVLHHATKAGGVERGSTALRGAVDTMLSLTLVDDLLTLACEKQKDAEPFEPIALRLVPVAETSSCVIRLARDVLSSDDLTIGQGRVLEVLQTQYFADGATAKELQASAPGVPHATLYRALKELCRRGLVQKRGPRFTACGGE